LPNCRACAPHHVPSARQDLGFVAAEYDQQLTVALEYLMEEDAAANRPFVAALVISKAQGGLPALGFFGYARRLGRFNGDPAGPEVAEYHATEFDAAVNFWGLTNEPLEQDNFG
jgi:hypothetical protein